MANGMDFKKLHRLITIYRVVQVVLLALLVFMAFMFQAQYRAKGMPQIFLNSIVASFVIQLLLFYPVNRFARGEAENEIAASAPGLTVEQQKALRQKRIFNDFLKAAAFIFFVTFALRAPGVLFVQSTILFSFILTALSYLQCHNYALKRELANKP
ncbi:MAG TPA: hypothetical protein VI298_11800 [Geobacteraceae bacterium]